MKVVGFMSKLTEESSATGITGRKRTSRIDLFLVIHVEKVPFKGDCRSTGGFPCRFRNRGRAVTGCRDSYAEDERGVWKWKGKSIRREVEGKQRENILYQWRSVLRRVLEGV